MNLGDNINRSNFAQKRFKETTSSVRGIEDNFKFILNAVPILLYEEVPFTIECFIKILRP